MVRLRPRASYGTVGSRLVSDTTSPLAKRLDDDDDEFWPAGRGGPRRRTVLIGAVVALVVVIAVVVVMVLRSSGGTDEGTPAGDHPLPTTYVPTNADPGTNK